MIGVLIRSALLIGFGGLTAAAHALTVQDIDRLLQAAPRGVIAFQEIRESPWLSSPIESRGHMRWSAEFLEKRVEQPRDETWRISPDTMEWTSTQSNGVKRVALKDAPAAAALAGAMINIVGGNLRALEREFTIEPSGDEQRWTVRLLPRDARVTSLLTDVEVRGTGSLLQVITVLERGGERTTTRFIPDRPK